MQGREYASTSRGRPDSSLADELQDGFVGASCCLPVHRAVPACHASAAGNAHALQSPCTGKILSHLHFFLVLRLFPKAWRCWHSRQHWLRSQTPESTFGQE